MTLMLAALYELYRQKNEVEIVVLIQGFFLAELKGQKTQTQEFSTENSRIFCSKTQEIGNFRDNFGGKVQISHENGGF